MKISSGNLYFVSDQFFQKIQDPYLKINYETTKRPHYFAITDYETGLYWLVPCSSKIEKFERIIQNKQTYHKPTDAIKIVKIFDKKTVLLFQDMVTVHGPAVTSNMMHTYNRIQVQNSIVKN